MPFGRHRGEFIGDIPKSYLTWVVNNINLNGDLRNAVEDVIEMLERSGG